MSTNPGDQTLVPVGDPRFTLATRKLAGSDQCLNCGTELQGPFCYYCGQPDRNFMRFFPALLRDLMEDLLDLDSRFMRTLKPLLFKPGRLTRDFMNGRRFRYTPPMRLYIFSSIAFFLLAALLSSNAITTEVKNNDASENGFVTITADTEEEKAKVEEALKNLPPGVREQVNVDQILSEFDEEQTSSEDNGKKKEKTWLDSGRISFNDEPWDRETNPVDIKWLPDSLNKRINDEIEESPKKAEEINKNPNLIVDQIFDILPATMFVLLPVVALIFKFWYLFAKRYYVEHLIFSLHNHAFIFVSLILILLANETGDLFTSLGHSKLADATVWLITAVSIWIPLYLLVSLRTVYQQNWFMTVGKFICIGISYVALLSLVTTGVAIASFVLL
jgi:copper chaperone CopZ